MTDMITNPDDRPEHRLTAAQIEKECPERLQQIGREIAERLRKADKQTELAKDHLIAVEQLLAEAKKLCDVGGFDKFRKLFCPQLGKSQAYALLAIAAGKKSLGEHRADERQRKQRTRANQKAAAANSGTVPENSEPASEPQGAPTEAGKVETTSTAQEQPPEPAKPRNAVKAKDDAVFDFSARVLELVRITAKQEPGRFAATSVPTDDLANLGKFLTDVAKLKKSGASKPIADQVPSGNGTVSPEQSDEDMKAKFAALDASGAPAA